MKTDKVFGDRMPQKIFADIVFLASHVMGVLSGIYTAGLSRTRPRVPSGIRVRGVENPQGFGVEPVGIS
ncbi:MAG: hypothetical protein KKI06_05015 [Euryarchaeota archaeon]|nr:hypothetical protein [Euryarchaeota archaeon]